MVIQNTDSMRKLTEEELEIYTRDGLVIIEDVFPSAELETLNQEIDRLVDENMDKEDRPGSIYSLGLRSPLTRDFCADERILSLIEEIVFPGIAIYSAKLVNKPPHGDANSICHWHQDDAYYTQKSQSRTRMSVWIPLQDAGPENGGVYFIPGSHETGLQQHSPKPSGLCRLSFEPTEEEKAQAIQPKIKAGSLVLFSAMTWHASPPNPTDSNRRAYIVSYQEATTKGGNEDQWKILRTGTS